VTAGGSDDLALDQRTGLPDALRVLLEDYPRRAWNGHENFGELVQFWMQRHMMFRQLIRMMAEDAERLADGRMAFEDYAPRLSHYGSTLLNELHGHHQIEDHHYFPRLVGIDTRVARGFDLLESDHEALDPLLHEMADGANAVLRGGSAAAFHAQLERFDGLLERHLTDEEEIVVPVILKSGFKA
jgi:iron-sulfur cluster repair protein YtfE (RIC family)